MAELEGRDPIINTPPHLLRHSKTMLRERTVVAWGAWEEGENIEDYSAVRIHAIAWIRDISERVREIERLER